MIKINLYLLVQILEMGVCPNMYICVCMCIYICYSG